MSFQTPNPETGSDFASRQLAAIVDSSDDAIISKDLNSIVTSWNAGAERIFGYSAKEMIGKSIMTLIPPELQGEEAEILFRLRKGERIDHFETVRRAKDGRRLNISLTVSPIKDPTGKVIGASKIARDITEWKATMEALKKAKEVAEKANAERELLLERERIARTEAERVSRIKDNFLATLSHELRTPLNAIVGWCNLLRSGNLEPEELREGLDTIERNGRVLAQLIDELLDTSSIVSGKLRLSVQRLNPASILNEVIGTVRPSAEIKGVSLHFSNPPEELAIVGDSNRLQQVFWNLLNNAIKFSYANGQVKVRLEQVNRQVEIAVTDTGEGIAPEFLPYVFNRFHQGYASTTSRHGGLGLGLAIVKQLVELHGGDVLAKSAGLDQGATFIVRLPIAG